MRFCPICKAGRNHCSSPSPWSKGSTTTLAWRRRSIDSDAATPRDSAVDPRRSAFFSRFRSYDDDRASSALAATSVKLAATSTAAVRIATATHVPRIRLTRATIVSDDHDSVSSLRDDDDNDTDEARSPLAPNPWKLPALSSRCSVSDSEPGSLWDSDVEADDSGCAVTPTVELDSDVEADESGCRRLSQEESGGEPAVREDSGREPAVWEGSGSSTAAREHEQQPTPGESEGARARTANAGRRVRAIPGGLSAWQEEVASRRASSAGARVAAAAPAPAAARQRGCESGCGSAGAISPARAEPALAPDYARPRLPLSQRLAPLAPPWTNKLAIMRRESLLNVDYDGYGNERPLVYAGK
jgi:hypothetical protein